MKRLMSSSLIRNLLAVGSGSAAGQAVVFAFSPLITRIYSPETFGLQGVFLSLLSILSPAIALRFPMAIVVADNDAEARSLAQLSMLIAFGFSCALGLVLSVAQTPTLTLLGAQSLGNLIWFLPLALFCVGLQDTADFHAARHGRFRLVAIVTVLQAFVTNLARVLGGLIVPIAGILVTVTSLAPAVQAGMLAFGSRKERRPWGAVNWGNLRYVFGKHRDFPLYRVPTDVLNSASQAVPVVLLAALFSPVAAGLYTLTRGVLNLPSNIIGMAIGNVIYARFSELARAQQAIIPLLLKSTFALLALSPLIAGLAWFAPSVFAWVFGEEWREAGYYARWMALWIGVSIANVPAVRLAPVIKAQRLLLVVNVIMLVMRVLAMLLAFWFGATALTAVATFSVVSLIANLGLIVAIMLATWRFEARFKAAESVDY